MKRVTSVGQSRPVVEVVPSPFNVARRAENMRSWGGSCHSRKMRWPEGELSAQTAHAISTYSFHLNHPFGAALAYCWAAGTRPRRLDRTLYRSATYQPVGWAIAAALTVVGALILLSLSPVAAMADSPHIRSQIDTHRCASCHSVHTARNAMLISRAGTDGEAVNVCLTCHNGSDSTAANVETGSVDSFGLESGHTLVGGAAGGANVETCGTCHDTHGAVEDDGRMIPVETVNGVAVNSAGPEMCLACHDASDSWFGSGYPATSAPVRDAAGYPVSGTWTGPATYASSSNAHRLIPESTATIGPGQPQPRAQGDCRYCHASHRAATRTMAS